jgi:hypothetical protein
MRIGNANDFFRSCQVVSIVGIVLLVGLYIYGHIALNTPNAHYTTTPVSLREYDGGETLPPTAANIYYARARRGFMGFISMYRFDAPAADCIAHGKRLLKEKDSFWDVELTPITSPIKLLGTGYADSMGLSQVKWFDIETIRSGFVGHQDATDEHRLRTFWIDTDRGRFYFLSSD